MNPSNRTKGLGLLACLLLTAGAAVAQQAPRPAWEWTSGPLRLQGGLDTYTAAYAMRGTWWNLAAGTAPSFDTRRSFAELWFHPKLSGTYALGGQGQAYGGLSVGITRNLSADAFDYDGQGAVRFENAHVGVRGTTASGLRYDLSAGRQPRGTPSPGGWR